MKRAYGNGKTVRISARVTPEVSEKLKKFGISTAEAIETLLAERNKTCKWTKTDELDEMEIYRTGCEMGYISDGSIKDNAIGYCPFCGGFIKV